jgi:hypothetical protein
MAAGGYFLAIASRKGRFKHYGTSPVRSENLNMVIGWMTGIFAILLLVILFINFG